MIGKVIEVFIPNEDFEMIGFKVLLNDTIMEFVFEQSSDNCNIYRDDIVKISYIDGIAFLEVIDDEI